jgi:cytoskeletal protein CcmA (bactofilin family)
MFGKDGTTRSEVRTNNSGEAMLSIIASGMRIVGDIESVGVIKVDGHIDGSVSGARQVLIARGGAIHGNVHADEIVIGGLVAGAVVATERLELQETAVVNGDIETTSIVVLEGAKINGSVRMRGAHSDGADTQDTTEPLRTGGAP